MYRNKYKLLAQARVLPSSPFHALTADTVLLVAGVTPRYGPRTRHKGLYGEITPRLAVSPASVLSRPVRAIIHRIASTQKNRTG